MKARTSIASGLGALSSLATAVALALTFGVGTASADSISYFLVTGNGQLSGFTGPFATVTVTTPTLNSSTATITFDSLTNGGYVYLMGDGSSVAVNVNATTWTLADITGTNSFSGFTPGPYSDGGAGNADGFGRFNQNINGFDGFTHSATEISFELTDTSGGTWSSATSVLAANNKGEIVAIHAFPCATSSTTPCTSATGTPGGITGYASGATVVPIPAAAWLFASGLIGLIGIARRSSLRKSPRKYGR